ncbi:unnamed protein product, partial [Cladocopium goreaui]
AHSAMRLMSAFEAPKNLSSIEVLLSLSDLSASALVQKPGAFGFLMFGRTKAPTVCDSVTGVTGVVTKACDREVEILESCLASITSPFSQVTQCVRERELDEKVTKVTGDHVVKASVKAFVRWSSDRPSDVPPSFLPSLVCPVPPFPLCFFCSGHFPTGQSAAGGGSSERLGLGSSALTCGVSAVQKGCALSPALPKSCAQQNHNAKWTAEMEDIALLEFPGLRSQGPEANATGSPALLEFPGLRSQGPEANATGSPDVQDPERAKVQTENIPAEKKLGFPCRACNLLSRDRRVLDLSVPPQFLPLDTAGIKVKARALDLSVPPQFLPIDVAGIK